MKIKVGFGFDVHQLKDGADFWLGGIMIPHTKGSIGHSDADVLIHTICDALLGAANLRDIGFHFPPSDSKYKGIDSKILLKDVVALVEEKGFSIGNIDATIALQEPKINPHIPEMKKVLSSIMNIEEDDVSIKATTTERLGFEGREEGVSAYAVVLIQK
ncbi:2-C-methyl-D-erythritol 2,4-cyclodiphosphate synthase [Vicingus serpentipes]|uniref:2-C-methyl-D-erythritol 2,4-cyclodiphosphate synthase n=1 Tax=Vicingus serpentipes TaxID=1926625 RepID=A0A5C6RSK0_9FLAO|nr:2-C-methyl-D-erythritol 2,4-cyclodiphosphate synthase [Vicingus serpentipes]TXB65238.1 2-C-methyl-D-erythritol 2,4-cyclodiphosphate synthase [Vicingus serpentipes]